MKNYTHKIKTKTARPVLIIAKLVDMDEIGKEGPLTVVTGTMKDIMEFAKERLLMLIEQRADEEANDDEEEDTKDLIQLRAVDLNTKRGFAAFLREGNYELIEICRITLKDFKGL
jgi:hypothetical protein